MLNEPGTKYREMTGTDIVPVASFHCDPGFYVAWE